MRSNFFVIVILLGLASYSSAREERQEARIDYLIHGVETSKDIIFIRNGSEHDGKAAAAHLRTKLNYAGAHIQTAEHFIQYCASESSLTHQKYKIKLPDGKIIDAAEYFKQKLKEFDEKKSNETTTR